MFNRIEKENEFTFCVVKVEKKIMFRVEHKKLDENYFSLILLICSGSEKKEKEEPVATLYFVMEKSNVYIENISAKYPGLRYGTFLLLKLCEIILQNYPGVSWIKLDDSTGILPPKNLYYKLGFHVKDESKKYFCSWNLWLKKYKNVFANPSEERMIHVSMLFQNIKKIFPQLCNENSKAKM